MRTCIKCHEPKDESEFYHPLYQDNICKECHLEYGRKLREARIASKEAQRLAGIEAYCRLWNEKERIG